jgi:DeoR/GlpR family transcriptional regulator of sugar metabolism
MDGGQLRVTATRRDWIRDRALAEGTVTIDAIQARFGVSRMTAHRDLDELARLGVVRKVRGGASAEPSSRFESDVRYRLSRGLAEKTALCAAALEEIGPGDSVLLDESTTALPLAGMLRRNGPVTVLSNFKLVLDELGDAPEVRVISLGGEWSPRWASWTGPLCRAAVERVRPDLFVTSTTAVDGPDVLHPDPEIADVKRAMLAVARRSILLVDASKIDRVALHRVAGVSDFDLVIVDRAVRPAALERLRAGGANVRVAAPAARAAEAAT